MYYKIIATGNREKRKTRLNGERFTPGPRLLFLGCVHFVIRTNRMKDILIMLEQCIGWQLDITSVTVALSRSSY